MSNALANKAHSAIAPAIVDMSPIFDPRVFAQMSEIATIMATGKATIPLEYRNSPGDCLAVIEQAYRWRMSPFAVAQKTFFVSGKIGYEAQLINAGVIGSGAIYGTPDYEWYGPWEKVIGKFQIKVGDKGEYRVPGWKLSDEEGIGVIVRATLVGEENPRELNLLLAQARTRNSTLWADDPRQQLAYLALKRWARLYCPGVILGVYSVDEIESQSEKFMGDADVVDTEKPKTKTEAFKARIGAKKETTPKETTPVVTLKDVLKAFANAGTVESLTVAAEMARHLESPEDQSEARKAYKVRLDAIRKMQGSSGDKGPTYAEIADMITNASDMDTLSTAADLIGSINDSGQRSDLAKLYDDKRKEMVKE